MIRLESVAELQKARAKWAQPVGFVPTMGALHPGHLALMTKAKEECKTVVASIFVNPTQFNDPSDLEKYPRPLDQDLRLLDKVGVDAVFLPKPSEIYKDGFRYKITESQNSQRLCGLSRPGHFDGVLTVVLKLFNLVQPQKAYFGEKDFQQLLLIKEMVRALFLEVEVIPVATQRERDGLAMSSRNLRLTPELRERAPLIYKVLRESASPTAAQQRLEAAGFKVDYVEEHWGRRLAAVFLGDVRLIDNVEV